MADNEVKTFDNQTDLLAAKRQKQAQALSLLRGQKLAILIPTIDRRIDAGLTQALLREQSELTAHGISVYYLYQCDSLIQRGRNFLAYKALATPCDWFMWIDSDIEFEPGAILALLAEEKSIIGGAYPIKDLDVNRIIGALDNGVAVEHVLKYATRSVVSNVEAKGFQSTNIDAVEVDNLGTGFLLTHRSVYEQLDKLLEERRCLIPGVAYENFEAIKYYTPYFDADLRKVTPFKDKPSVNDYLSEDYYFCMKARELGIKSYVLPCISLKHVGTYVYEGDYLRGLGLVYPHEKKKDE